jgi:DNA mismatch repair protein MutS
MSSEKELIIDTYINYTNKYKELYGNKTVILMEVGSFYEFYGTENEGADVKCVSEMLNIQCTRKDKSVSEISKKNHLLAGFPSYILKKYIDILINENYTVVLCEQTTPPPKPKREITEIISPATYIDIQQTSNNNFLMSVYFSVGVTKNKDRFITASLSWVDINTNKSFVTETSEHDTIINLEDVNKTILSNKPSEIVIFTDIQLKSNYDLISILNNFVSTLAVPCIHNKVESTINENFFKISYQNTVFNKVFKNTGILSVIEFLDLENKPLSIVSFSYLLQFCYEHNEKILEGIEKPVFLENTKYLGLVNNAIDNLNILSKDSRNNSKTSSILNLLNNCKTSIGKRYFRHCLTNPLTNINKIQERYDYIEYFIQNNLYEKVRVYLSKISDLERTFKRLSMKSLQPSEFSSINISIESLIDIIKSLEYSNCNLKNLGWNGAYNDLLNTFVTHYTNQFNFEEMDKVNLYQISKNIFNKGIFPEVDALQNKLYFSENIFENVIESLNEQTGSEFKLELNKDQIRSIVVTKNRFENLLKDKSRLERINKLLKDKCNLSMSDITSKPFSSTNKTTLKIYFKDMNDHQSNLTDLQTELKNKVSELYIRELDYILLEFKELFLNITKFIAQIDFFTCNAKNAVEKCYIKPIIVNSEESYINAEKIRHPLIEVIQTDTPYIANDIIIGTEDRKGILLYGLNSVGKSSYMKSVGINLILAQAGLYVAAKNFEYSPYHHIFCRIPSGDNLFKGQSTFVAEINELRTILKRSTTKSLIIGDELCCGTESVSAISIVTSGINYLSNKKSSFIFATHLHEVSELDSIKKLNNVKINHLSVHFDMTKNCLVFDRVLKEGNGNTLYGLEIAKSLDLPKDFLYFAEEIRKEYTNTQKNIVQTKPSIYNKNIFIDKCNICNSDTEEIHHIAEQQYANSKGILEDKQIHKNIKHNLMNVCSSCHDKIHANEIKIEGYKQTSNGIILEIETHNKDISQEDAIQKRIKELRNEGKSYNKILEIIKEQFQEQKITLYKIKKILS